jgi:hypothetical protein
MYNPTSAATAAQCRVTSLAPQSKTAAAKYQTLIIVLTQKEKYNPF